MALRAVLGLSVFLFSSSAFAGQYACLVGITPEVWMQKSGQHPVMTMNMLVGENVTTPMVITVNKEGEFTILFRGANGMTCVQALGTDAVMVPQGEKT